MNGKRWLKALFLGLIVTPLLLVCLHLLIFRHVQVPITSLMVIRMVQGEELHKNWVPLEDISPLLIRDVIAGEDQRFCSHGGVDVEAVRRVIGEARAGGRLRGASTISMQTVKNLYLWPSRSFVRKGLEFGLVHMLELFWSKERIMEVYLNIVELGPGIYGVEAASRHHFGRSAARLKPAQAAALVAILPAPRAWNPKRPTRELGNKVRIIRRIASRLKPEQTQCISYAAAPPSRLRPAVKKAGPRPAASRGGDSDRSASPPALEQEDAPAHYQATPQKPRRGKRKKIKPKRRRGSR